MRRPPAKRFKIQLATKAVMLLSIAVGALAQQQPVPDPLFIDALWVSTTEGTLKIGHADGTLLLEIAPPLGVRAVAVDEVRGRVWVHNGKSLSAFGFDGQLQVVVPVPICGLLIF